MNSLRLLRLAAAVSIGSAPLGLLALVGTAIAAPTTYFVSPSGSDGNSGKSADQPFKTIQKAADSTNPGDVVQVMGGTYRETATGRDVVNITRSGSPGAPITFEAFPGQKPVLNPVTGWHGIRITGASHIRIRGLEVAGDAASINLDEARKQAGQKKPVFNTNCIGAYKDEKTGKASHHLEITGNHVHHCPGIGISAIDADHVTIDRNWVHSTSWYTEYATSGISILRALDEGPGDPSQYKIRITGNVVHDNETKVIWTHIGRHSDGNGIIIDTLKDKDNSDPAYKGRVLVANNISFDNGGSGIHSFKSQHVDIVNNTAYLNSRSTNMEPYANIFAAMSDDVRILNNISVVREGKPVNSTHRNTNVTYDHNIYFGGKKPEAMGPNDIVADPKLAKPGTDLATANFRPLEGSPAIDSGTAFDLPAHDVAGKQRTAGRALDRGAFEFPVGGEPAAPATAPAVDNAVAAAAEAVGTPGNTPPATGTTKTTEAGAITGSGGLARTGASVVALAVGGAVVLAAGGVTFWLARRKRAHS
ncbi:choice-of-anchor Q domain-containing protein [Lentzea sp. NEAU-D7]|uniref:choice-of-anchor Q domain-containing protein n=1 Tax=Lentzea sp. NEAU-D7 TaxID=2994667 RepID=UPI00224A9713|nr:choice-of-anchor Q domain-containing protein [Lentzea sp. NEAU-D7]MCX2947894.1 right-handed parallel beta-helix repeat-containing protein [Lentzea sp. NEAU-D7]